MIFGKVFFLATTFFVNALVPRGLQVPDINLKEVMQNLFNEWKKLNWEGEKPESKRSAVYSFFT